MSQQIDYNNPIGKQAAAEVLRRRDNFEAEANITSAIRDFLIGTGLAGADEIVEELRKWLRASAEGPAVEEAVGRLLAGGG